MEWSVLSVRAARGEMGRTVGSASGAGKYVLLRRKKAGNQDTVRTIKLTLTGLPRGTSPKLPSVTKTSPRGALPSSHPFWRRTVCLHVLLFLPQDFRACSTAYRCRLACLLSPILQ